MWIDKGRMPPDLKNVPEQLNSGRLRHPVFGNKRRWVNQYASPPWWNTVVRQHTPVSSKRWPASSTTCGAASSRSST